MFKASNVGDSAATPSGVALVVETFPDLPVSATDGQLAVVRTPYPLLYEFDAVGMSWVLIGGYGVLIGHSGSDAIANGLSTVSVVFANPMVNTAFNISFSLENILDSQPIFLIGYVSSVSTSGFSVTFNAPVDSANYVLNWSASYDV